MAISTQLEKMEQQAEQVYGGPKALGFGVDHVLLEMSDTNKWIHSEEQSDLGIGLLWLHAALVASDNRKARYITVKDDTTGGFKNQRVIVDNWKWLLEIDHIVKSNQLTIGAFSREQFLRQAIAGSLMAPADGEPKNALLKFLEGGNK